MERHGAGAHGPCESISTRAAHSKMQKIYFS